MISTKNGDDDTPDNFSAATVSKSDSGLLKSFANINETGKTDYKRGLKMVLQGGIGGSAWLGNYTMRAKVLGSGDYVICETPSAEGDRTSMTIKGPDPLPITTPTTTQTPTCPATKPASFDIQLSGTVCGSTGHAIVLGNTYIKAFGGDRNYTPTISECEGAANKTEILSSLPVMKSIQKVIINGSYYNTDGGCDIVQNEVMQINRSFGVYGSGAQEALEALSVAPGLRIAWCGGEGGQHVSYNLAINISGYVDNNCSGQ